MWGRPQIIAQITSPYSGEIKVVSGWGFRYLQTGDIQQSGGLVADIWQAGL